MQTSSGLIHVCTLAAVVVSFQTSWVTTHLLSFPQSVSSLSVFPLLFEQVSVHCLPFAHMHMYIFTCAHTCTLTTITRCFNNLHLKKQQQCSMNHVLDTANVGIRPPDCSYWKIKSSILNVDYPLWKKSVFYLMHRNKNVTQLVVD